MGQLFGQTADGRAVEHILLDSGTARCGLLTYGATLVSVEVPDRRGRMVDIALGFDRVADYEAQICYMGGLVGRVANRIAGARVTVGGVEYRLSPNEGENHLHGGAEGFHRKLWRAEMLPGGVRFSLTSPDGDEGYPGTLRAAVTFTLEGRCLTLDYEAISDRDTLCSLTNHAYWNLGGHGAGDIGDHLLTLHADAFTPIGADGIPTGAVEPVAGTPMDFGAPTAVGARIGADFAQLRLGSGYDHNFVLRGPVGTLRPAAELYCPSSGIVLEMETTSPGLQFYSGNFLGGCPPGKGGAAYHARGGLCLEAQYFPDALHHPAFLPPLLPAGEVWRHRTRLRFGVRD